MKYSFLLFFFFSFSSFAQPTDNPYRSFYPNAPIDHWSDSIRWSQLWNIANFQDTTMVARYNKARDFVAMQGGGVLFFPAGTYLFEGSIQFVSNVVIRGETPTTIIAKDSMFAPPTRFVFPAYIPSDTGLGTPNSSAFKSISTQPNTSNSGMVFVDVNRASVSLRSQTFVPVPTPRGTTGQSTEKNRNLILFGIRSNNVAAPYNTVPSVNQYKWQRFSSPFASNLSLYAWKNACIANCRINDFERNGVHPIQNLSFEQPGYLAEKTVSGNVVIDTMLGYQAVFNYTDHHGISVNRKATISNANPEEEPGNFCTGLEVRDNWIYKTMRVGIICSGLGIVIDNNLVLDKPVKQTWLHPIGSRVATNNAATYENRGIDFGGWNVQITRNELFVYRHKIYNGPYYSVDGEGILLQECCGGTSVNGARISKNKTHNTYIGLWKVRDINQVVIDSNETGNEPIIITANVYASSGKSWYYSVTDSRISDNQCSGVEVDGNRGGRNLIISGNQGPGTATISAPCYAQISNNSGFSSIKYTAVKDTVQGLQVETTPCLADTNRYPEIQIVRPASSDTTVVPFSAVQFKIRVSGGQVDSVFFYENVKRIASLGPEEREWLYQTGACNSGVPAQVWASVKDTARKKEYRTAMKNIRVTCITGIGKPEVENPTVLVYPNPASERLYVSADKESVRVVIRDLMGRTLIKSESDKEGLSVSWLPSGVYMIEVNTETKMSNRRFLIQR